MESYDVLVLGGGISGVAAALAATAAGARTALVRRGPGATALAAGGWQGTPPAALRAALAAAGLELVSCAQPLPHPDGALRRCDCAPPAHARAAIGAAAERTIVCGIAGLPGFHATALAALWADAAGLPPHEFEGVEIVLPDTPPAGWAPLAVAALIERSPRSLARPLADRARERGAARVILPAVIGVLDHDRTREAVQSETGLIVAEALAAAPSLPGWRLDHALMRALHAAGVAVVAGSVHERAGHGRSLQRVVVAGEHGALPLAARAFVLATGKFIGGGIAGEHSFEEVALDCDVALERFGRTFDDPGAALVLTDAVRTETQPVLALGVVIDEHARPLRPDGTVCYDNVVAAGGVLAGAGTDSGLGTAAASGWNAGEFAAGLAR
ncbi:MAG TPA: FAD-binding protein [Longimicrobiales bacterium]|nr:FAD-binding protein [Longimicrobiales bacterium]